jgi:N-acetylglucosamine-6-phosphate deacetylase
MIVLTGAALVLPDRVLSPGTVVIEDGLITEIRAGMPAGTSYASLTFDGHYIVPGFIDLHVHGVEGVDSLDTVEGGAIRSMAHRLPRYGVTAFCPTTVACGPGPLRRVLTEVKSARETRAPHAARVLPAHLESNFISPEYNGAQPAACLRSPSRALHLMHGELTRQGAARAEPGGVASQGHEVAAAESVARDEVRGERVRRGPAPGDDAATLSAPFADFTAADICAEIERGTPEVGIVTMAPELDGSCELIKWLTSRGLRVSLGHSGASYDQALDGIAAGARQATHLFNQMPPLHHRAPGLVGAVLQAEQVAAEIICDGFHVHPALIRATIAAKQPSRVCAITDGTAASGLNVGGRASLGGRSIVATQTVAALEDGTTAGSVWTMDRAFQTLVRTVGLSLADAAIVCATTPARELGLDGLGVLAPGAAADLAVLDRNLTVVQTYVAGRLAYDRGKAPFQTA